MVTTLAAWCMLSADQNSVRLILKILHQMVVLFGCWRKAVCRTYNAGE